MGSRPANTIPRAIIKFDGGLWEVVRYVVGGAQGEGRLVLADCRDVNVEEEFAYKQVEARAEVMLAAPVPVLEATPPSTECLIAAARRARSQPTKEAA